MYESRPYAEEELVFQAGHLRIISTSDISKPWIRKHHKGPYCTFTFDWFQGLLSVLWVTSDGFLRVLLI